MASVALVVDHPQRDLLGLVMVAYRLCAQGVTCHLVPARLAKLELAGLAPDVVLLNHVKRVDEPIVEMLADIGARIAVLDTEGGVIESFETYERGLSTRHDLRRVVDCYCAWGPEFSARAEQRRWFERADLVVTGPPRFDFYRPPWRSVVPELDAPDLDQGRSAVLLAGTFTLANSRFLSVEEECRILEEEAHQDRTFIENRLQVEKRCLQGMVELANELAQWAPEVQWLYRPHPFERRETYEAALDGGVTLRPHGSVQSWLLSVDALIQRGSTTAVEAALAGATILSPDWLPEWLDIDAIHMVSIACADVDAVKQRLEPVVLGEARRDDRPLPSDAEQEIVRWFAAPDGNAHRRVADALVRLLPDGSSTVQKRRAAQWFAGVFPACNGLPVQLAGRLRLSLGIPRDFSFARLRRRRGAISWDEGGRAFSAAEVERILELIRRADPDEGKCDGTPVAVARADDLAGYPLGYGLGRSLTVFPSRDGAAHA